VKPIKNKFRELRLNRGLTQKDIADALSISQVSVWQWEAGESLPKADKLPAIAELFGCTIEELFEKEETA